MNLAIFLLYTLLLMVPGIFLFVEQLFRAANKGAWFLLFAAWFILSILGMVYIGLLLQ